MTDIKWVITVPPLWDIKGKKLMQEQAKNAGMVNLDVVLEPEAASLALFYEDNPTIILIKINYVINNNIINIINIRGLKNMFNQEKNS